MISKNTLLGRIIDDSYCHIVLSFSQDMRFVNLVCGLSILMRDYVESRHEEERLPICNLCTVSNPIY